MERYNMDVREKMLREIHRLTFIAKVRLEHAVADGLLNGSSWIIYGYAKEKRKLSVIMTLLHAYCCFVGADDDDYRVVAAQEIIARARGHFVTILEDYCIDELQEEIDGL